MSTSRLNPRRLLRVVLLWRTVTMVVSRVACVLGLFACAGLAYAAGGPHPAQVRRAEPVEAKSSETSSAPSNTPPPAAAGHANLLRMFLRALGVSGTDSRPSKTTEGREKQPERVGRRARSMLTYGRADSFGLKLA